MIEAGELATDEESNDLSEFEFDDDGRVTVALRYPIAFGQETVTELRFRELKGKDMRTLKAAPGQNAAVLMSLAGKLSGQPAPVIDELRGVDLRKVLTLVASFMDGSLDAGAKSSEP